LNTFNLTMASSLYNRIIGSRPCCAVSNCEKEGPLLQICPRHHMHPECIQSYCKTLGSLHFMCPLQCQQVDAVEVLQKNSYSVPLVHPQRSPQDTPASSHRARTMGKGIDLPITVNTSMICHDVGMSTEEICTDPVCRHHLHAVHNNFWPNEEREFNVKRDFARNTCSCGKPSEVKKFFFTNCPFQIFGSEVFSNRLYGDFYRSCAHTSATVEVKVDGLYSDLHVSTIAQSLKPLSMAKHLIPNVEHMGMLGDGDLFGADSLDVDPSEEVPLRHGAVAATRGSPSRNGASAPVQGVERWTGGENRNGQVILSNAGSHGGISAPHLSTNGGAPQRPGSHRNDGTPPQWHGSHTNGGAPQRPGAHGFSR